MEKPKLYDELGVEGFISWQNAEIFKDVVDITQLKSILEIGFYRGASAFLWLHLSNAKVLSVDSMRWEGCSTENIKELLELFPERFTFICESTNTIRNKLINQDFHLFFLDGGHTADIVTNDIQMALDLNPEYIFVDDYNETIFYLFSKMTSGKYEVVRLFHRKADQGTIPMALAKKKKIKENDMVYDEIQKWKRIFNEESVEIPSITAKLKRMIWKMWQK